MKEDLNLHEDYALVDVDTETGLGLDLASSADSKDHDTK